MALISAVALAVVVVLFTRTGSRSHGESAAGASLRPGQPGPTATADAPPRREAPPAAEKPAPGNTAEIPPHEQSPSIGSTAAGNAVDTAAPANALYESAAAEPPAPRPNRRGPKIAAQCWGMRGSAPNDFTVTLDREVRTSGQASAVISSVRDTRGYTTMFQTAAAAPVRGKRVEFSADVRTRGATASAYLLLRAEDANGDPVAFDNMSMNYGPDRQANRLVNRAVRGDTEWSTENVVVDIPENAAVITYGMSLEGTGKAWIDNARMEVVTDEVEPTGIPVGWGTNVPHNMPVNPESLKRKPRNLEFELETVAGAAPCN